MTIYFITLTLKQEEAGRSQLNDLKLEKDQVGSNECSNVFPGVNCQGLLNVCYSLIKRRKKKVKLPTGPQHAEETVLGPGSVVWVVGRGF